MITRRHALAGIVAAGSLAGLPKAMADDGPEPSLATLAAARGLRFGASTGVYHADQGSLANAHYAALLEREAQLVVPENELKWPWLHPTATDWAFDGSDMLLAWAHQHGKTVRGHNLWWADPTRQPGWLATHDFGPRPASAAAAMIERHIRTVIARYGRQITSYDAVNEAIVPQTGALHQSPWSVALGSTETALDLAFHTAREAAPWAELVYNDYMSWELVHSHHRDGVLRLLEGFRRREVPVDALGLQSHLAVISTDPPAAREWRQFLDAVTGMGYRLLITEFDVRGNVLPADPTARDAQVAALARAYLDLTLSYPQLRDVVVWGLCNRFSWLRESELRPDGLEARGCLYDDDYAPTPLRAAFAGALAGAPKRI